MTLPTPADWPVTDPLGETARDLLAERAASTPDATALIDAADGDRWSYAAFDDRVARRAAHVGPALDGRDGRIGLCLGTRVAFAETYFAASRLDVPVVPLNVELPADRLRTQAARADVDVLVCELSTESFATDAAPSDARLLSVDDPDYTADDPAAGASRPLPSTSSTERPLDADRVVLFTSGTTGQPKGVRLTGRNLVASAVGSAFRLGVVPDDRWLVCLPTYHMGGLAPLVRSTLYGTTTVIQRSFDPGATADAMAEFDVTGVSLVPTMLSRLLDADWTPPDSLRFVLLGGAPADRDLLERALERDVPVYPTYGLTETASQVATATPTAVAERPGTVGRPIRGTTVSILDGKSSTRDGGPAVDTGDVGEFVVDGPTVTPGYLDDAQTEAAFCAAGLRTGDLGYRDEAGRLWVVGRTDDRIVTGGENVQPARVAAMLREIERVADVAVVGLPDDEWGERVAALVVADGDVSAESVRAFARDRLAAFEVPKTIDFADELPRTASGTVDREAVRQRLAADEGN